MIEAARFCPEAELIQGNKIIHYCWFGGKPLTKLAKKCLRSWEKYLPDYKIIRWDESNFDVNCNEFCAKAYQEKKWAFVADVARCYALKKYGGLYFDTDMCVKRDISHILEGSFAAGWESDYNVAAGIIWVRDPGCEIMEKLWDYYENNPFDMANVYSFSIPTLLTGILQRDYGLEYYKKGIQYLRDDVRIYPCDYFYPLASDGVTESHTENTCMIHYYLGSWLSRSDQLRAKFKTIFGKRLGMFILKILVFGKHVLKAIAGVLLAPYYRVKKGKKFKSFDREWILGFDKRFESFSEKETLVICNENWLGVTRATKELFGDVMHLDEIYSDILIEHAAERIAASRAKFIVFSGFAVGWSKLVDLIREKNGSIRFKVLWHGGIALNSEYYDWEMFKEILAMLKLGTLESIGFVKKSSYEFFKTKGLPVEFVMNRVEIDGEKIKALTPQPHDGLKIGLYASGDRWVKNFYNQLCAASLFENASINCIPLSDKTVILSKMLNINISGSYAPVEHDKMLSLLAGNDINFYTTFTECAPIFPLESLEMGVPCITGNNHHYFDGTPLYDLLVVDAVDNIQEIYKKACYALEHKDEILQCYRQWKDKNIAESIESAERFIKF